MRIEGSVALVTGGNRGIGREFVRELLARDAEKVYVAVRDPGTVEGRPAVVPIALDVTDHDQVAAVAARCSDVQLLVNNAGVNLVQGLIAAADLSAAELEIRTNYLGPLALCRAFAPVLKAGGGWAIVMMVSILARAAIPACGSARRAGARRRGRPPRRHGGGHRARARRRPQSGGTGVRTHAALVTVARWGAGVPRCRA
jgi:NAD(P)-dependent dehydrogenase (short-subunit alcohol dehydrogenase family)